MTPPEPKVAELIAACMQHASELIQNAKLILKDGTPNIAFHLAVLALEEIGKANLLGVEELTSQQTVPPAWPRKHLLNHEQKLFWAFFGGSLFRNRISKAEIASAKSLSKSLHERRLAALYVDVAAAGDELPSKAVPFEQAENIVNLADALLVIAMSMKPRENLSEEELSLQSWFIETADNPEHRHIVFSRTSLEKLEELDNPQEWARWLKTQFEKADADAKAAATREIERSKALPTEGTRLKWRVRFRLHSASHFVRPNAFSRWNETLDSIQLSAVSGRKKEMLVDLIFRDNTPIHVLYHFAWALARHFTVALNIGTLGYFWWQFATEKVEWFESVVDLDDTTLAVKIEPSNRVFDWGRGPALTLEDMDRVIRTFASLQPFIVDPASVPPFLNAYAAGLSYLAASSVHLPQELRAVQALADSFRHMAIETGEVNAEEPFAPFAELTMAELKIPEKDRSVLSAVFRALDNARSTGEPSSGPSLTVEMACNFKTIADYYYLRKVQPKGLSQLKDQMKSQPKS